MESAAAAPAVPPLQPRPPPSPQQQQQRVPALQRRRAAAPAGISPRLYSERVSNSRREPGAAASGWFSPRGEAFAPVGDVALDLVPQRHTSMVAPDRLVKVTTGRAQRHVAIEMKVNPRRRTAEGLDAAPRSGPHAAVAGLRRQIDASRSRAANARAGRRFLESLTEQRRADHAVLRAGGGAAVVSPRLLPSKPKPPPPAALTAGKRGAARTVQLAHASAAEPSPRHPRGRPVPGIDGVPAQTLTVSVRGLAHTLKAPPPPATAQAAVWRGGEVPHVFDAAPMESALHPYPGHNPGADAAENYSRMVDLGSMGAHSFLDPSRQLQAAITNFHMQRVSSDRQLESAIMQLEHRRETTYMSKLGACLSAGAVDVTEGKPLERELAVMRLAARRDQTERQLRAVEGSAWLEPLAHALTERGHRRPLTPEVFVVDMLRNSVNEGTALNAGRFFAIAELLDEHDFTLEPVQRLMEMLRKKTLVELKDYGAWLVSRKCEVPEWMDLMLQPELDMEGVKKAKRGAFRTVVTNKRPVKKGDRAPTPDLAEECAANDDDLAEYMGVKIDRERERQRKRAAIERRARKEAELQEAKEARRLRQAEEAGAAATAAAAVRNKWQQEAERIMLQGGMLSPRGHRCIVHTPSATEQRAPAQLQATSPRAGGTSTALPKAS